MAIPAFVLAVGLGVDLAGHTAAQQEARSLAGEAARAAGQYLVIKPGVRARAQPARGERAAASYLAASGLTGRTHVAGDGTIVVEVEGAYETRFLSLMGVTSLPVAGTARAQVVTVVDGEQR